MALQLFGPFRVDERTTAKFSTNAAEPVKDENGVLIPGSAVNSCTLELYDRKTLSLIKGPISVLNTNGGSWDESGNFSLRLDPDDSPILNDAIVWERHIAHIEYVYAQSKVGRIELLVDVRNILQGVSVPILVALQKTVVLTGSVASPQALTTLQSGCVFTDTGAASERACTLPPGQEGLVYGFRVLAAGIKVIANGTDTIRVGGVLGSAGGFFRSTALGSELTLLWSGGLWSADAPLGPWSPT